MYDFWYTLGAATIKPRLLGAINDCDPGPKFQFVDRKVIETINGRKYTRYGPSTGLVDRKSTTAVRLAIVEYLGRHFDAPPPTGIYTAGRLCQLMNIKRFQDDNSKSGFDDIIDLAHLAYRAAIKGGLSSDLPAFPAVLGLCLMDVQIVGAIRTGPSDPNYKATLKILREFELKTGTESWKIVKAFVMSGKFAGAVNLLMAGNLNPWGEQGNTLEQAFFWVDDGTLKGEHVVP